MKKFIAVILIVAFVLSLSGCGDDTNNSINNQKGYIATGHPEWWPIMYRDGINISGVGPDLVKRIFDDVGVKVSVEYEGNWENVLQLGKDGLIDILVGAYKTTERELYYSFSDPYATDPIALFVKNGKSFSYAKWDDLIGKKGVAMTGDSYGEQFDQYIATNLAVTRVGTSAEAFSMLNSGTADYFLYSFYSGKKEIAANYIGQFVSLSPYIVEESFYIAISKKSQLVNYLPQINVAIAKYKNNGTIDNLLKNYFQQIVLRNADPQEKWKEWQTGKDAIVTQELRDGNASHGLSPAELVYYCTRENNSNFVLLLCFLESQELISKDESFGDFETRLYQATNYDLGSGKYPGLYPQMVALTFQWDLDKKNGLSFAQSFQKYNTGRHDLSQFMVLYSQYREKMNIVAGTNYSQPDENGNQIYSDFQEITIQNIQTFLEQYPSALKRKNLFKEKPLNNSVEYPI